jgi:hypothetical protein
MTERTWERTDNFESKLLPKLDRWFVSGHHKVELHCTKTQSTSLTQRVLTHTAPDPKAAGTGRDHEPRIGHVRPEPGLIGPKNVRPDNFSLAFCDVTPIRRMEPVPETLFAPNAWVKGICIATNYDRVKDIPDRGAINCTCLSDLQHLLFCSRPIACGKLTAGELETTFRAAIAQYKVVQDDDSSH